MNYIKLPKNVEKSVSIMDHENWCVQWVTPCQQTKSGQESRDCGVQWAALPEELPARHYISVFLPFPFSLGRSCQLLYVQKGQKIILKHIFLALLKNYLRGFP